MQNSKLAAKKDRPTAQTVVPNSNATTEDARVSGSHPHQVPSPDSNTDTGADTVPRRGRGNTKYKSKIPRNTTSSQAATSQTLPPSDASTSGNAPTRKLLGQAAIQAFQNKFQTSSTADDQSLAPPDASTNISGNGNEPPSLRGYAAIQAFHNKFNRSNTADEPESQYQDRNVSEVPQPSPSFVDPHGSQPGAFPEGGSLYTTQTRTNHAPTQFQYHLPNLIWKRVSYLKNEGIW
jgi:hypothetical protein